MEIILLYPSLGLSERSWGLSWGWLFLYGLLILVLMDFYMLILFSHMCKCFVHMFIFTYLYGVYCGLICVLQIFFFVLLLCFFPILMCFVAVDFALRNVIFSVLCLFCCTLHLLVLGLFCAGYLHFIICNGPTHKGCTSWSIKESL